jgi:lysophospholipase L1-like esterase
MGLFTPTVVLHLNVRRSPGSGSRIYRLVFCLASTSLSLLGCRSPTTPIPPDSTNPPKITCPAPLTLQSPNGLAMPVTYGTATVTDGKAPVNAGCTPVSGATFPVGESTVTCTATDSLQRSAMCTFNVTVVPPPLLRETSFLAFGDSLTWGEDGRNSATSSSASSLRIRPYVRLPLPETYPGALQQRLASTYPTQTPIVFNAGNPGESVTDSGTFGRFTRLTSSGQYRVVLIMEGSNDLGDRDAAIVPSVIQGLRQMIGDAKSRGIRPFLATVPPMTPGGSRALAWSLVGPFDDRIRELAANESVTLVDVFQGFGNDFTLIGSDGLHPNAQGYAKIADLFFAAIRQTLEVSSVAVSVASQPRRSVTRPPTARVDTGSPPRRR